MERKHVFLPEQLIKRINAEAKKHGVSFSEILRRILTAYFQTEK